MQYKANSRSINLPSCQLLLKFAIEFESQCMQRDSRWRGQNFRTGKARYRGVGGSCRARLMHDRGWKLLVTVPACTSTNSMLVRPKTPPCFYL